MKLYTPSLRRCFRYRILIVKPHQHELSSPFIMKLRTKSYKYNNLRIVSKRCDTIFKSDHLKKIPFTHKTVIYVSLFPKYVYVKCKHIEYIIFGKKRSHKPGTHFVNLCGDERAHKPRTYIKSTHNNINIIIGIWNNDHNHISVDR